MKTRPVLVGLTAAVLGIMCLTTREARASGSWSATAGNGYVTLTGSGFEANAELFLGQYVGSNQSGYCNPTTDSGCYALTYVDYGGSGVFYADGSGNFTAYIYDFHSNCDGYFAFFLYDYNAGAWNDTYYQTLYVSCEAT